MADMNQEVKEVTNKYSLRKLIKEHNMMSVLHKKIEHILPSVEGSKRTIDHIISIGVGPDSIVREVQLPHGMGFQSNHRCIYANIDMETEIVIIPMKAVQWKKRALSAKNRKRLDIYVKEISILLDLHTVFTRAEKLLEVMVDGHINRSQNEEYQKLDSIITDSMIQAEKSMPQSPDGFSKEM